MALREYLFNGRTYQIADEDLPTYPGAVLIESVRAKETAKAAGRKAATPEPANKSAAPAANKRRTTRTKAASG